MSILLPQSPKEDSIVATLRILLQWPILKNDGIEFIDLCNTGTPLFTTFAISNLTQF